LNKGNDRVIQSEIDRLDNPHVHSATVFGIDGSFLARVHEVIRRFDLAPIDTYLEFAQSRRRAPADLFDGFVDTVRDGVVGGWAGRPERTGAAGPARGASRHANRRDRPQRLAAARHSERRLSERTQRIFDSTAGGAPEGFRVTIANSTESLHNAGTWRQGWHCE
jgi:hypothetical protein